MRRSIRTPPRYVSLQQRRAATLSSMPSSAAIIRSRRETRIYRFRPNSVQRDDFPHPRSFLPLPFHSRDQPTAPAMTIAPTALCTPLALECVPEGLCERLRDMLRLLCARVCARICIHVCIPLCVAIVELCSNCAKLRISVSDELRDLQYNCATFSLLSLHPIPPLSTRLCHRVRKNYSFVQDICAAYVWYRGVYVYVLARATCTNKHGRATPRNIGVLYPGTRYLRKRITR